MFKILTDSGVLRPVLLYLSPNSSSVTTQSRVVHLFTKDRVGVPIFAAPHLAERLV